MKKFLVVLIAVMLLGHTNAIENRTYKFEYITADDGLSQSTIEQLYQDSHGFIWIGTRDGINRYDGRTFEIFRHDNKDTNSLAASWVSAICEDINGNIWIGSNLGINIYYTKQGKMTRLQPNEHYRPGKVAAITNGPDGKIWFGSPDGPELVSYDIEKNEYKSYDYSDAISSSHNSLVFEIIFTKDGRMFFAPEAAEIVEFIMETETFEAHPYRTVGGLDYKKSIVENEEGELYIGSEYSGLHLYNPDTKVSRYIEGLSGTSVKTDVLCISPTEVWVGVDGGGVNILDPTTGEVQILESDSRKANTISENAIFNLMQDRDGNIWVGHFGSGISIWKPNKQKFLTFKHNPFDETSISKEVVTALFEDSNGNLWVGQDGGGLLKYNPKEGNFKHFWHEEGNPESLSTNVILAITENEDGNLVLSTYAGGFMIFNPETEKVERTFLGTDGLSSENVWDVYIDGRGWYWISALGLGINIYNPYEETFKYISNGGTEPTICSHVIMKTFEAPDGKMWLCSEFSGVCILDPVTMETFSYSASDDSPVKLSGNDVKGVIFQENYIWIATLGGGLNRIETETNSVRYFTTDDGLASNALTGMLEDNSGNIWISSTKGLMKFNPETEKVITYDKSQGTQGNEYKYNSYCKFNNGYMAFGGSGGFSMFHPDSIKDSEINAPVVFTDFKLYNESASVGQKESVLKEHINFTERIVLKPKHKVFTFEFASLDYTSPGKNQYFYMLEGYDEDWVEAGNKNYASYTNVRPGRYTFLLKGTNSDGVESSFVREVKVRVRPPFYRTKGFIIIVILLTIYIVNYFVKERVKQNKRDKELLQQKIDEGKKELNEKISEIETQQAEIKAREEKEMELRFTNTGIVKMSEIISRDRDDISKLSADVISTLVDYIEANAGVIYILNNEDENDVHLYPSATYCYDSEEKEDKKIFSGEGYVGTAYSSKEVLYVDDMPDGKIVLSSGLGDISIKNVAYIPIINNDDCLGIFEIGSIQRLDAFKVDFIQKVADSLGAVLAIEKANKNTKMMLEHNQQQSEELKAQEEEMRQNLEEMYATQEEYARQLEAAEKIQVELDEAKKTIKELREGKK